MIGKILSVIVMLVLTFFAVYLLYENIPQEPVFMKSEIRSDDYNALPKNSYSLTTPVFAENLRFATNKISYSIEESCPEKKKKKMKEAFKIFEDEMGVIKFYEDDESPLIYVYCSSEKIKVGQNLFAAGEGGPSKIINTTNYKIIEEGKIVLYQETDCDYPVIELHELSHVFGFDHSENKKSVVYPTYSCDQRITKDMVETIRDLYSVEPLPDLKITDLYVIKSGKYIDFNLTVINQGLANSENTSLYIKSQNYKIAEIPFEGIDVGYGRIIKIQNLKIPDKNIEVIEFIIDYENKINELDESNNIAVSSY